MGNRHQHCPLSRLIAAGALLALCAAAQNSGPVQFDIKLDRDVTRTAVSGRLFVFMSTKPPTGARLETSFFPGGPSVAAIEVDAWKPGETIHFVPGGLTYPAPFSEAKPGHYWFMAQLDPDHSYAYHGSDDGDLYGSIVERKDFDPATGGTVALDLNMLLNGRTFADTATVKLVEFESPSLSAFWGRPIRIRAGVVLPPDYLKDPSKTFPTIYEVHGFGGNHTAAWYAGPQLVKQMEAGKAWQCVRVFLDGSFPTGHHEFADSVNNGPWGHALTAEFIPYLEKQFRLIPSAYARFLTGHSSGGWSTLWLQINYPDLFGGTWSTSPDPTDFRFFTGVDAASETPHSAYLSATGQPLNLVRMHGKEISTMREFVRQEQVMGEYGGQMASFEWVFSPRGQDGRPMKLFNRTTGEVDPVVVKAWAKYDIDKILARDWETLGPRLKGKLHIVVGSQDNFHLEVSTGMTCDFLKSKDMDVCEIVPGRDHMDLYNKYKTYPGGLQQRFGGEMRQTFEESLQRLK